MCFTRAKGKEKGKEKVKSCTGFPRSLLIEKVDGVRERAAGARGWIAKFEDDNTLSSLFFFELINVSSTSLAQFSVNYYVTP